VSEIPHAGKQRVIVKVHVDLEDGAFFDNVTLSDIRLMVDAAIGAVGGIVPTGSYVVGGTWEKVDNKVV
jgi:hypothetical protein